MLTLTRRTDYALVALARLAAVPPASEAPSVLSARQIGQQYGIPVSLLMNVLKDLVKGGLVRSARGARGGYSLARPAAQITIAHVVESLEGPVRFTPCCGEEEEVACKECQLVPKCPITDSVRVLNGRIHEFLTEMTLADLVAGSSSTLLKRAS